MKLVDPFKFTKFDRTPAELEAMILFSIMVANKRADQTYAKFEALMEWPPHARTPFDKVRAWARQGTLLGRLKQIRAGQYKRIARAFRGVLDLDLRACTVKDLETVHGIGPKTARMFLLHSRPNQRLAVLDTHVLAYLRDHLVPDVPRSTPPAGKTYARLEQAFLGHCDANGKNPAQFDLEIWEQRTKSVINEVQP